MLIDAGDAAAAEPATRAADADARAAQAHRDARAAVQPRQSRSRSARSCSSKLRLPVLKKTAERRAVDRRGSAGEARRGLPAAEAAARTPRPVEAEVDLHRQAAGHAIRRDRPRAHQLRPGGRGDRAAVVATIPTCRTSRSAPRKAGASARRSSRRRGSCIVSADYSQIELRIMAHISRRRGPARRAFATGEDIHRATAAEVFGAPLAKSRASSGATPR